jgi:hypothetical protein
MSAEGRGKTHKSGENKGLHVARQATADGPHRGKDYCGVVCTAAAHYVAQTAVQWRKRAGRQEIPVIRSQTAARYETG